MNFNNNLLIVKLINSDFIKKSFFSLLIRVSNTFLAFISGILIARIFGPEDYGAYSFIISTITIVSIPIIAGIPNLFVREIAKSVNREQWQDIYGLIKWGFKLIIIYFFVLIASLILIRKYTDFFNQNIYELLLIGVWYIPFLAITLMQSASLRGLGFVVSGQIPSTILNQSIFIIFLIIVAHVTSMNPICALKLKALSAFITVIITCCFLYYYLRKTKFVPTENKTKRLNGIYSSLIFLTLIGSLQIVLTNSDILILGILTSKDNVGIYKVGLQISNVVAFGLTSVNLILHPRIAELYSSGDIRGLQAIITHSSKLILLISLLPVIIIILFGEPIIKMLFGNAYAAAHIVLIVLSVGHLINAGFGSVGALLNMTNNESATLYGMLSATFINVILNLIFIPFFGPPGAAISTVISCLIWNIILRKYVISRLSIEPSGLYYSYCSLSNVIFRRKT